MGKKERNKRKGWKWCVAYELWCVCKVLSDDVISTEWNTVSRDNGMMNIIPASLLISWPTVIIKNDPGSIHVPTLISVSWPTVSPLRLTFTWWGCCGLCQGHKPVEFAHPFFSVLVSISVFMALSTVFHFINSPDTLCFSLCSSDLISALLVFSTNLLWKSPSALIYWFVVDWA